MTMAECSVMVTLTVLLAIQPVCCTQSTYYVKPTPDTPCPSEPCLTLSEYAQGTGPLFTSNTTMVFLPGDHRLYNDIETTNIITFTMVGDSTTLPEITSSIVCTGPAAFIFQNISYLKIQALELSYCGSATLAAMQLIAIPQFELSNSAFYNSRNTSLEATGSGLTITETIFHGSSSTGLSLSRCTAEFLGINVFSNNMGSGVQSNESIITFNGSTTFVNNSGEYGGGILAVKSNVHYSGSTFFTQNRVALNGGGIFTYSSIVSCDGEVTFAYNSAETGGGGISGVSGSDLILVGTIIFTNNSATIGGGIEMENGTLSSQGLVTFVSNSADVSGGGIFAIWSDLLLRGNITLTKNSATHSAGIALQHSSLNVKKHVSFASNLAEYYSGGIGSINSSVTCEGICMFINNSAEFGGGVVAASGSVLNWNGVASFTSNSAIHGAGIHVQDSTLSCKGYIYFKNNSATFGGGFKLLNSTANVNIKMNGAWDFINNTAKIGGAILVSNGSNLTFSGNGTLINNTARYSGGAVGVRYSSSVTMSGHSVLLKNAAEYGGGMHLSNSNLKLMGTTVFQSNSAVNGGGIHGIMATITINGSTNFNWNSALKGGGLSISSTSHCFLSVFETTSFIGNHAEQYGGAVFIADDPFVYCTLATDWDLWAWCFFHLPEWDDNNSVRCVMTNNTAGKAGGALYGGMVDRCLLIPVTHYPGQVFNETFHITKQNLTTSVISSDPYQVCPCSSGQPDCSIHNINITVYPGETFLVPVVAVGQRNGTVPAVVKTSLEDKQSMLDSLQEAQSVNNTCTALQYTIYSISNKETMTLTAEGPCLEMGESLIINITLLQCPTGFMLSNSTKGCTCEKRLQKYITNCNITSRTIDRDSKFWVGVDSGFGGTILHQVLKCLSVSTDTICTSRDCSSSFPTTL